MADGIKQDFDEAVARRIWEKSELTDLEKTNQIIFEVFGGDAALAGQNWLQVLGFQGVSEEEKKKASATVALVTAKMEMEQKIKAEYEEIQERHSVLIDKIESENLFKNEVEFDTDFKSFGGYLDETLPLLSKENVPDEVLLDSFTSSMKGSKALKESGRTLEDIEAIVAQEGGNPEHDSRVKVMCYYEGAALLNDLGLCSSPHGCVTADEVRQIEDKLGIKMSELSGMNTSDIKDRREWVFKFEKIAHDTERYDKLMQNPDIRLDAFRDKKFADLSMKEKDVLSDTYRDMQGEKAIRLKRIELKEKGVPDDKIEEYIAEMKADRGLIEDTQLAQNWQKSIDLEVAGKFDEALNKRIRNDIEKEAGQIQSLTFKKILQVMPEKEFNEYVKSAGLDNSKTKDELIDQLRKVYQKDDGVRQSFTEEIQKSMEQAKEQPKDKAQEAVAGALAGAGTVAAATAGAAAGAEAADVAEKKSSPFSFLTKIFRKAEVETPSANPLMLSKVTAGTAADIAANTAKEVLSNPPQKPGSGVLKPEAEVQKPVSELPKEIQAEAKKLGEACGCSGHDKKPKEETKAKKTENDMPKEAEAEKPMEEKKAKEAENDKPKHGEGVTVLPDGRVSIEIRPVEDQKQEPANEETLSPPQITLASNAAQSTSHSVG